MRRQSRGNLRPASVSARSLHAVISQLGPQPDYVHGNLRGPWSAARPSPVVSAGAWARVIAAAPSGSIDQLDRWRWRKLGLVE